tara:strand:- start:189 stop:524 length:336 start_codon:yes stop_codon:yes gene_type:complete
VNALEIRELLEVREEKIRALTEENERLRRRLTGLKRPHNWDVWMSEADWRMLLATTMGCKDDDLLEGMAKLKADRNKIIEEVVILRGRLSLVRRAGRLSRKSNDIQQKMFG